jgi:hypothetical protein
MRNKITNIFQKYLPPKPEVEMKEIPTSRAERRGIKVPKKVEKPKQRLWVQIRIIPIWLRIILVLLLLVGAAAIGAMIGYGYIGDGNPSDALKKETWMHIIDILKGKE